jgi:Ni,Fe-hydrogenase I large subunit
MSDPIARERDSLGAATEMIKQMILGVHVGSARAHQFVGIRFCVNPKEMGHLLGENLIDLPFSRQTQKNVVEFGRALSYHIHPESERISYWIRGKDDLQNVTAFFQLKYERLKIKKLVNFMLKVRHTDEMILRRSK